MSVKTMDSNVARDNWREMLDTAMSSETDVVVTRYGKPVVAIIAYEDFAAIQEAVEELRAARRASIAYAEWQKDNSVAESWESVKQELADAGLIDDPTA
jgi:prevent-host-death family protein